MQIRGILRGMGLAAGLALLLIGCGGKTNTKPQDQTHRNLVLTPGEIGAMGYKGEISPNNDLFTAVCGHDAQLAIMRREDCVKDLAEHNTGPDGNFPNTEGGIFFGLGEAPVLVVPVVAGGLRPMTAEECAAAHPDGLVPKANMDAAVAAAEAKGRAAGAEGKACPPPPENIPPNLEIQYTTALNAKGETIPCWDGKLVVTVTPPAKKGQAPIVVQTVKGGAFQVFAVNVGTEIQKDHTRVIPLKSTVVKVRILDAEGKAEVTGWITADVIMTEEAPNLLQATVTLAENLDVDAVFGKGKEVVLTLEVTSTVNDENGQPKTVSTQTQAFQVVREDKKGRVAATGGAPKVMQSKGDEGDDFDPTARALKATQEGLKQ